MEVEIGKEGLKFENGAFTYYGVSALTLPSSGEQRNCRRVVFCNFRIDLNAFIYKSSRVGSLALEWKWNIMISITNIKLMIELMKAQSQKNCKPSRLLLIIVYEQSTNQLCHKDEAFRIVCILLLLTCVSVPVCVCSAPVSSVEPASLSQGAL